MWKKNQSDKGTGNQQQAVIPPAVSHVPSVVDRLRSELRAKEETIRVREAELATIETVIAVLNNERDELASDLAWFERTPQAVRVLTSLLKRYGPITPAR